MQWGEKDLKPHTTGPHFIPWVPSKVDSRKWRLKLKHKIHLVKGSPRAFNWEVGSGMLTYSSLRFPAIACLVAAVVESGTVGWSRGSASELIACFPLRKNPLPEEPFRVVLLFRLFRQWSRKDSVLLTSARVDAAVRTVRRRSSGSTISISSAISSASYHGIVRQRAPGVGNTYAIRLLVPSKH